ncbi:ParA family protein [Margalitia sp. FSL K6-0131]|uniref:ParA family protein n=1 Tax=Margalitia sp. FSL K6-0131 TaxID=2954604 RepID=UPI0030F4C510
MAKVINVANFKGGVGKTTTTVLTSYILAKKGYKTLVVDLDPQANATDMLLRTADIKKTETTLYEAMKNKDFSQCLISIKENLDILPSDLDLVGFPMLLNEIVKDDNYKRAYYVDYLLRALHDMYDFIFIDVPPTISDYTNNAVVASDYVLIVMQTHERSLSAAEKFIPYLQGMIDNYGARIELLGVVPVLMKNDGTIDGYVMELAKDIFQENLFKTTVKIRERIKRFDVNGITEEDHHDAQALKMYEKLVDEMLERIEGIEG